MENDLLLFTAGRNPLYLATHLSGQHHSNHLIVAQEGPQGILKCCRLIFLDEEMSNPRGAITWDKPKRKKPPPACRDEEHGASYARARAKQVKQARCWLAVFRHVVRPEFSE